jgi:hypothetical protein
MTTFTFKKAAPMEDTKWCPVVDDEGDEVATFLVKPQDVNSTRWEKELSDRIKRLPPVDRKRFQTPRNVEDRQFSREVMIRMFVDLHVVDSKVPDAKGKLHDHSNEMVLAFFCIPEHYRYFLQVDSFASQQGNFRKEGTEEAKNA